jgi:hypothetical protein
LGFLAHTDCSNHNTSIEFMLKKKFQIVALVLLLSSSGLHAQYRWDIIQPANVDTFVYAFDAISSYGNSCVAWGAVSSPNNSNSYFTMTSTDGGVTWVKHPLPLTFDTIQPEETIQAMQQIDSLNVYAISTDVSSDWFWRSSDGGATWSVEVAGYLNFEMNFSSALEGIIGTLSQHFYTTSDGGKSWNSGITTFNGATACRSYGNGIFRIMAGPFVYTTLDYGDTVTNSYIGAIPEGPYSDTNIVIRHFQFGNGDTIRAFGVRLNDAKTVWSTLVFTSSDVGAHWVEQPIADTTYIAAPYCNSNIEENPIFLGEYPSTIVIASTDHGNTWATDTVVSDSTIPNYVNAIVSTSSGNAIGIIPVTDTVIVNGQPVSIGASMLVRLVPVPAGVTIPVVANNQESLYPNPATNILNIASPAGTISISDPLGRSYAVSRNGNTLDISSLPPGVYFVSDGVSRAKFVKE